MKILGILGSPRPNGATAALLDAVLQGAREAGAETERVGFIGMEMQFCRGCVQCYRKGRCIHNDGIEAIKAKMLEADGIVLGSPVYIRTVTAQMKTLMDRCANFIHCFLLDGKYGASVATAGGMDQDEVAEFSNGFLRMCGATTVGGVGALGAGNTVQEAETVLPRAVALGRDLASAIAEKRAYPEQDVERAPLFELMKNMTLATKEIWPAQYDHWVQRGWL